MKCPRCEAELNEVKADEIVLDKCMNCGGIWFDFAEMERVLGKDTRLFRGDSRPGGDSGHADDARADAGAVCPRCDSAKLVEMCSSQDPDVTVLGCLSCYGRWLDGEELERMHEKGLLAKLRILFREIW